MVEHLPWTVGGLFVGFFVGYSFGKYRGLSEAAEELPLEDEIAEAEKGKAGEPSSQEDADSTTRVFARRGGSHYHREGCRHLRRRTGQSMTKAEAVKKGFKRCPSCRP